MRRTLTLSLCLLACGRSDPELRVADLQLRLLRVDDCRPRGEVTQVVVQALGDFPPSDENTIDVLRPSEGVRTIDRFPPQTRMVAVRASSSDWVGLGVRALEEGDTIGPLLLVPEGRSCPLADFGYVPPGAEVVPLPNGGLLVVGGEEGPLASRRVARLDPGQRMSVVLSVDDALDTRRTGHSLVVLSDRVLAIGGAGAAASGPADDAWEVYDVVAGRFTGEGGRLTTARVHAAATPLPDGRVVVAGGKLFVEGAPLASVEVLDPRTGRSEARPDLNVPQYGARLLTLDDGSVLLFGGRTTEGRGTLPWLWAWDPETESFSQLGELPPIGVWVEGYDVTSLEGGRVLLVGSAFGGNHTRQARLIEHVPPSFASYLVTELDLNIPDLTDVRVTQLDDGRVLVTGRDEASTPRAFAFDLADVNVEGRIARRALEASRVPEHLLTLADGLVAELAASGSSLRRVGPLHTFLHNPPASLTLDELVPDGPGRWSVRGGALVAETDDARLDVPTLRFADLELQLEVEAPGRGVEILLRPELAPPVRVVLRGPSSETTDGTAGPALCEAAWVAGAPVTIRRRGAELEVEGGADPRRCILEGLGERVGVGFRAPAGARLRNVRLRRL